MSAIKPNDKRFDRRDRLIRLSKSSTWMNQKPTIPLTIPIAGVTKANDLQQANWDIVPVASG
ncbi:MAG: hypothetical protein KME05_19880 [Gloeocapsa sp. UFS-A4-WI-NPMV-4B04]|nr:hypothetical protein [Gloeocapsa sp. UFS-A4-WI-NPMV-4B04]